jgi:translocation and assembly module TamB
VAGRRPQGSSGRLQAGGHPVSRRRRTLWSTVIAAAGLIVTLVIAVLLVVRTAWFRNYVRQQIVSSVEDSTGGRVEVKAFDFDESHLHATVTDFVIHGTEPASAAPFVSIPRIEIDFRLFPRLKRLYGISFIDVSRPQVNVSLQADGHSNIPTPNKKSASNQSTLETVVDLAVDRFVLEDGLLTLFSVRQPLTVRGSGVRARLDFSLAKQAYGGTFVIHPLYVLNGRNTPVDFTVTLPVNLTKDRIDLHHVTIATPLSQISADASIEHMNNPTVSGHVRGRIAGTDLAHAGNIPLAVSGREKLPDLELDAKATGNSRTIRVAALHAVFGQSTLEASGTSNDAVQIRAELALREMGRLADLRARPDGMVSINAFASFQADPRNLDLRDLRVRAFGGEFDGSASLADFERYRIEGRLRGFDIQALLSAFREKQPYDGNVSGTLEAHGDTKTGGKDLAANAHITIAPGQRGIPVSGRVNAAYNGAAGDVTVENSYVALPHSRLNLSGSLEKRLNVSLTSKDLHDFMAPAALTNGGTADFTGAVSGAVSNPHITGHLAMRRFAIEGRQFDSFAADVSASGSAAAVSNAALISGRAQAHADGRIALKDWSPTPRSALTVNAAIKDADLGDVAVLAGQPGAAYSGALSASVSMSGTYGSPLGRATVQALNGTIDGEPFNRIQLQANMSDRLATVSSAFVDTPAGRVDLSAEFRHPRDSFTSGQLQARVRSGELDFSRMAVVAKSSGSLSIDADVAGTLCDAPRGFLLNAVNGNVSAKALDFRGVHFGDFTATAHSSGQNAVYDISSDLAGSKISLAGNTKLTPDYPTNADLRFAGLPIERALAAANQSAIPARGTIAGSVRLHGTLTAPEGDGQIELAKANLYGEAIDQARLRFSYHAQSIDVPLFEIAAGPSRIDATAHFDHPFSDLRHGQAQFRLTANRINLARIANVQKFRAGLGGAVDLSASGSANIRNSNPGILLTALNANVSATGLTADGKQLGNLNLTANTEPGQRLSFALDSNLAGSTIHGSGNATLDARYPIDAKLSVRNAAWTRMADLLGRPSGGDPMFEAATDADIALQGPLLDIRQLNGSLQIAKLNVTTTPRPGAGKAITIANSGPIQLALDHGIVRIQNARVTGPNTDIQASGSGSVTGENLNLNLRAHADLGIAQNFDRDIYSGGSVAINATVRGDLPKPLVNGQLTLQNATFSAASLPIGVSNANGSIAFNGDNAQIRTLTAESGGGRISASGFASFADKLRFSLQANASGVRVRVQQGVSVTADANLRLTGTTDDSRVTGTATVGRISYAPQSDFGSILTRSAPAVQSPESYSSLLSNMKLDIRVRNLSGMTVESSLSEDLQTDIDLRVRGTAGEPGVQGRINVTSGQLLFFGTNYTVDRGSISFYNPFRIEPVLDASLATQAQGVSVTVRVTGPVENMKLSYTSDPPLQFQEIVALLAAGTTPTSDPTLLANQPAQPAQGFQQMGESAILGQAVANPIGSQMQRVFGVTQLKIDPSFTTGSAVPTARLALQQRITKNLTFTYVQAVDTPNSTTIRMEWAFSPMWSAVATRDQFGLFSLNFLYKREFR